MRAVDTNVLVRLITRDDPEQTASAESFISTGAWISTLVLSEALWVLASVYEIRPSALATAVEMLLNHRDLTIHDRESVAAALALFPTARRISPGGGRPAGVGRRGSTPGPRWHLFWLGALGPGGSR